MGITKLALKIAAPAPKVEEFSDYLFIGPHPDDIEIGCGATIARLTAAGKKVSFLILTDGSFRRHKGRHSCRTPQERVCTLSGSAGSDGCALSGPVRRRFL